MSALIEVKYFNSFIIKKVVTTGGVATWPGIPWDPTGYPSWSGSAVSGSYQWYLEESRIRGGYNNTEVGYGVRAYITEENDDEIVSSNSLTYSGISVSYTHLRAHETVLDLVCRLLL